MGRLLPASLTWTIAAFREVLSYPGVRRLELSWAAGIAADAGLLVALLVVTYEAGGALGVGILAVVQMIPALVIGPLAAVPLERVRGDHLLTAINLTLAVAALAVAALIATAAPVALVYVVAAVAATVRPLVRPVQNTLLPALARTPGELVAATSASSVGEGLGAFLGSFAAAVALASVGPLGASIAMAGLFGVAAAATIGLTFEHAMDAHAGVAEGSAPAGFGRLIEGVRVLARRPGPAVAMIGFAAQVFVRGLLIPLIVVASIELLGLGESGVGTLSAAIGLGGLIGAVGAVGVMSRSRVSAVFALALAFWGLPLAVIGAWSSPWVAIAALTITGASNALLDIAGFTVFQRACSNAERVAVFGLLEGVVGIGLAAGGLVAPMLLEAFGARGALGLAGAVLPILAVATWPIAARMDHGAVVEAHRLRLIRGVPIFAPLPLTAIERLAMALEPAHFEAGQAIMRKGEPGDRFVILETGSASVTDEGRLLVAVGPGAGVGEIALLRGSPRTATVIADEDLVGWSVDRASFLAAVAGPKAAAAAEAAAAAHLARSSAPEA